MNQRSTITARWIIVMWDGRNNVYFDRYGGFSNSVDLARHFPAHWEAMATVKLQREKWRSSAISLFKIPAYE